MPIPQFGLEKMVCFFFFFFLLTFFLEKYQPLTPFGEYLWKTDEHIKEVSESFVKCFNVE